MRLLRRGLASLLAAVMLLTALPAMALAEEPEGNGPPVETEGPEVPKTPPEEEKTAGDPLPKETEEDTEEETEEDTADTVIYNLLDQEITVGTDAALAEETPWIYQLFDADGDYTIELEPDAFFPYEVQFTYEGETWEAWFLDPDDTVTVGGHTFSVASASSGDAVLTQAGVWVGDTYIPAYPEEKEFTARPRMAPMSLLPLTETRLSLDLKELTLPELKMVQVSTVLSGQTIDGQDAVVWAKNGEDNFAKTGMGAVIDLTPSSSRSDSVNLELIVGTADQLDPNNTRYLVTVSLTPSDNWLLPALYMYRNDSPEKIELLKTDFFLYNDGVARLQLMAAAGLGETGDWLGLTLALNSDKFKNPHFDEVHVYLGSYETVEAAEAAEDVSNIWGDSPGNGSLYYKSHYLETYTIVTKKEGRATGILPLEVYFRQSGNSLSFGSLFLSDEHGGRSYVQYYSHSTQKNGLTAITETLYKEYPADALYALTFTYQSMNQEANEKVTKAVVGHYDSLESAAGAEDIKDRLFGTGGYTANYSGDGVNFTVFAEGAVYKATVRAEDGLYSAVMNSQSGDTYVQFQGLQGDKRISTYQLPYEHDAYYQNGFQTIFTTEDLDLQNVCPVFWNNESITVYAGGTKQTSGVSRQDFSSGPVQYSAAAENGEALKNYWLTVVKKAAGPKLFVNGVNGPDGYRREVFLDNYTDNRHDIFIANVGDTEITGLSVTLDASCVRLDDYWTVQEEGKRTLAPFAGTEKTPGSSGELSNVAKIRLLPDGTGEISGTLTIKGENIDPVVLQLTGVAGDPAITSTDIPQAVKYVPYSSVIQTSNKYDWNQPRFELISGSLPNGVILRPNGELYGVPTETGSFPFTVRMENSYYGFSDSTAVFTLTVLNNTASNVEGATDAGYELLDRVPDSMTGYTEQVFRSGGEYGQFVDFWLDGEKLAEGTDYVSEEGSTKITIRAQTFQNAGGGTHTIAAEFRAGGKTEIDSPLKRAAQNYSVSTGGGGGGSSGGGSSKPSTSKPSTGKEAAAVNTAADVFADIHAGDWFAVDVDWAYQSKLMLGVTATVFAPQGQISPVTAIVVLARMDGADLSAYADAADGIPTGQWYTAAANWARAVGLLPEGPFAAQPPIARGALAVMLVNYLRHIGVDCTVPENRVEFADAAEMTQEENDAFQVLYSFGIFQGRGGYVMDVNGATTRAQLAVLLHRVSVFAAGNR